MYIQNFLHLNYNDKYNNLHFMFFGYFWRVYEEVKVHLGLFSLRFVDN